MATKRQRSKDEERELDAGEAVEGELMDPEEGPDESEQPSLASTKAVGAKEDDFPELKQDRDYHKVVQTCKGHYKTIIEKYWKIGEAISGFMDKEDRAAKYGKKLYLRLAHDIGMDYSTLYRARAFYLAVPESEKAQFFPVTWGKAKQLLPLLQKPEAKEAVVTDLGRIQDMEPAQFKDYIAQAYKEHLDKDFKQPGRPVGQKTEVEGTTARHVQVLKNMATKREFKPVVEDLEGQEGFLAVFAWKQGEDTGELEKMLEGLLKRIRS